MLTTLFLGLLALLALFLAVRASLTGTAMTDFLASALLNGTLRNIAYTPAVTVYLGLYTVMPTDSTAGTEVAGGAYARQAIAFGAPAGSPRASSNSGTVTFPTATANWGTVVGVGIFDASTAGNLLLYGTLTANQTVNSGGSISFSAGQVPVTFD